MYKRSNIIKGGSGCADYVDPAMNYRHCFGRELNQNGGSSRKYIQRAVTSETNIKSNPVRGGSLCKLCKRKQNGGVLDYPFENQYNDYSLPPKVIGDITSNINTNYVSNKDMFGCLETQRGGSMKQNQRGGSMKQNQRGSSMKQNQRGSSSKGQRGGDCGCAGPIMLGGSMNQKKTKKQTGRGYGYEMNIPNAITNKPEVLRYSTEGTGYSNVPAPITQQTGGSGASDNLMEYFLNFQTRCRGTEIY